MAAASHFQQQNEKPCHIGALMPELIDQIILEIGSLRTLGSFITTSRFIYKHFERRKRYIIYHILQKVLGPVLADAQFLLIFPYADVTLDSHYAGRYDPIPSLEVLTKLCHDFYKFDFLASFYIKTLGFLSNEGIGPAGTTAPSRAEQLRVLRAFYRRQIICNGWAPTEREIRWVEEDVAAFSNTREHPNDRLGLLATFDPWELQQVDHVDHFVERLCVALCAATEETVTTAKRSDCTDEPPAQGMSDSEFGNIYSHFEYLVQYMREHTDPVKDAIRILPSLPPLRSQGLTETTPVHLRFIQRYFLIFFRLAWQSHPLILFPDPVRDQWEEQEEGENDSASGPTVDFAGDALELPTFGWVDALDRRDLYWFGEALVEVQRLVPGVTDTFPAHLWGTERWRAFGFALWDRQRVGAMKEVELLKFLRTGWVVY
ncbi:hypothetical protein PT974_05260 [Cladobotryum mycophilum]|uniref:Uncharacterized protein n=1 Tax=Cladobotryum mycophilum TaxID=491253 RepID=A0ABR0SI96_9HYPO